MSQLTQAHGSSAQARPTRESCNASSAPGPANRRVRKALVQRLSKAASTSPSSDAGTSAPSTGPMLEPSTVRESGDVWCKTWEASENSTRANAKTRRFTEEDA